MLKYLLALDEMFSARWDYWTRNVLAGKPLSEPIPTIKFESNPSAEAQKNLKDCMSYAWSKGNGTETWMSFVDWLLWGFASPLIEKWPQRVPEDVSWHWYKTFNLGLLLEHPADTMAWASCNLASPKGWQGNGYFPTPMHICQMMADMQMTEGDKTKTVNDPCLGTGSMLLAASNYSLRLSGQDISLDMVKMTTVNAYLFMPWLICSYSDQINWQTDEEQHQTRIEALNNIKEWQRQTASTTLKRLTYEPKSGTLSDWF